MRYIYAADMIWESLSNGHQSIQEFCLIYSTSVHLVIVTKILLVIEICTMQAAHSGWSAGHCPPPYAAPLLLDFLR